MVKARWATLVGALGLLACRPELAGRPSSIAADRVLAVSSEPAEAKPGAAVRYQALYVCPDAEPDPSGLDWAYCTQNKPLAIESAGTWTAPQQRLPQDALRYAQLLGLDLEEHRTRVVDGGMLNDFDLILVMEKGHKEALKSEFPAAAGRVRQLAEMVEGDPFDIPDPVRFPSVAKRDRVLDDMLKVVERGFPRITELAPSRARSRR